MTWNVLWYNINSRKIETYDVLKYTDKKLKELKKKNPIKTDFAKALDSEMMYHYWGRSEYEILVKGWCGSNGSEERKLDIYSQLKMNWNNFVDYVWNELKKKIISKFSKYFVKTIDNNKIKCYNIIIGDKDIISPQNNNNKINQCNVA